MDQSKADVVYAKQEFERISALVKDAVATEAQFDQAQKALRVAQQSVRAAESSAASTLADLGGNIGLPIEQHASYLAAKAKVALAERNVRLTRILAPFAGTATRVENIQPGSYLTVGAAAFSLIGSDTWVDANIKETDLTHIKVGDPATIVLDSYPGQTLQAKVQSITLKKRIRVCVDPSSECVGQLGQGRAAHAGPARRHEARPERRDARRRQRDGLDRYRLSPHTSHAVA